MNVNSSRRTAGINFSGYRLYAKLESIERDQLGLLPSNLSFITRGLSDYSPRIVCPLTEVFKARV